MLYTYHSKPHTGWDMEANFIILSKNILTHYTTSLFDSSKKGGGPTPDFSYWTFFGFGGQWICRKFEISDTFL